MADRRPTHRAPMACRHRVPMPMPAGDEGAHPWTDLLSPSLLAPRPRERRDPRQPQRLIRRRRRRPHRERQQRESIRWGDPSVETGARGRPPPCSPQSCHPHGSGQWPSQRREEAGTITGALEGYVGHAPRFVLAPPPRLAPLDTPDTPRRGRTLPVALSTPSCCPGRGKPLLAQPPRAVPRTRSQATARPQHHAAHPALARSLVGLEAGMSRGAAGHIDPRASPGVPAVLAVAVHSWTPADPFRPPSPHPAYGL
jgi:hypothetical protein